MDKDGNDENGPAIATALTQLGRDPFRYSGFVNAPVFRGSTVLFPDAESLESREVEYTYGRPSNPTTRALELALAKLEGGERTFLTPSGLSAVSTTLLSFAETGGHILISDSVYMPTRRFANRVLKRLGVDIEYYDPLIGDGIARRLRPETKLVFTEFARVPDLRDSRHPRDLQKSARPWRPRRHRQYLGHPALFPRLRPRREHLRPGGHEIYCWPCRRASRRDHVRCIVKEGGGVHARSSRPLRQWRGLLSGTSRAPHARRAAGAALEVGPRNRRMAAKPPRGCVGGAPCPCKPSGPRAVAP